MTITRSLASMTMSRSCSTKRNVIPVSVRSRSTCSIELSPECRVDAGHRLVEQNQSWLRHQDAGEVEELALAAGENACVFTGVGIEPEEREQLGRTLARVSLARAHAPRV